MLLAAGQPRALSLFNLCQFLLYALTVLIASRGGLTAVCIAVAAFQVASVVIAYRFLLHRLVDMPKGQIVRDVGPALVASGLMFGAALPLTALMSDAGAPALAILAPVAVLGLTLYALLLRALFACGLHRRRIARIPPRARPPA